MPHIGKKVWKKKHIYVYTYTSTVKRDTYGHNKRTSLETRCLNTNKRFLISGRGGQRPGPFFFFFPYSRFVLIRRELVDDTKTKHKKKKQKKRIRFSGLRFCTGARYIRRPNLRCPSYGEGCHRSLGRSPCWWPRPNLCKPASKAKKKNVIDKKKFENFASIF